MFVNLESLIVNRRPLADAEIFDQAGKVGALHPHELGGSGPITFGFSEGSLDQIFFGGAVGYVPTFSDKGRCLRQPSPYQAFLAYSRLMMKKRGA